MRTIKQKIQSNKQTNQSNKQINLFPHSAICPSLLSKPGFMDLGMVSNGSHSSAPTSTMLFNKAAGIINRKACIFRKIAAWIKSTGRTGILMSWGPCLRWCRTQAGWEHSHKVELYGAWSSCGVAGKSVGMDGVGVGQCLCDSGNEEWWILGRGSTARQDGSRGPCLLHQGTVVNFL